MKVKDTYFIDFETFSALDLKEVGIKQYAEHYTTGVWCMSYAYENEFVKIWTPADDFPYELARHVARGGKVSAHNSMFERMIWNNVLRDQYEVTCYTLKTSQLICTQALALTMGLPADLERACLAVGLGHQKDMEGHRLMLQMCRPREVTPDGQYVWWDESEKLERLIAYCIRDSEAHRDLHTRLVDFSEQERKVFNFDAEVNRRGIKINIDAVETAIKVVAKEKDRYDGEIVRLTDGWVSSTNDLQRMRHWLCDYHNVYTDSVDKEHVTNLLARNDISDAARAVLECRQSAGRTSTAKLRKMTVLGDQWNKVYDTTQYHGANTGRWAGRGIQIHNFPRPKSDQYMIDTVFDILESRMDEPDVLSALAALGNPMDLIADSLRGMIVPQRGKVFLSGDFANIEGRVLAWLAGEGWKVDAFKAYDMGFGPDLYKLSYSTTFSVPIGSVTTNQRQIGKTTELALGYQGGVGAFQSMARTLGVKIDDAEADDIKEAWRVANPAIQVFWYRLENAAQTAVEYPGHVVAVVGTPSIRFKTNGSWLTCTLPSGRVMYYAYPQVGWTKQKFGKTETNTYGLSYMSVNGVSKKWERTHTYGGKLAENVVSGLSRDLLALAMLRLDKFGWPIVMHVHDEAVVEMPDTDHNAADLKRMHNIMEESPTWAEGLPISVSGWWGYKYRK